MKSEVTEKYSVPMRVIHWVSAVVVLLLLGTGWYMTGLDKSDALRPKIFYNHKSLGLSIFILACLRVFIKKKTLNPELPSHLPDWNKKLASGTHYLIYAFLFIMPLTGMLMTQFGGRPLPFFFFEIPNFLPKNKEIGHLFGEAHENLAFVVLGLVVFHIAGVLKESILRKKNVIKRMI